MLTKEQAIELMNKEGLKENIIQHSLQVNKIANYLADKLLKKGIKLNKELTDIGSLLHDIGRAREHHNHGIIGYELLNKLNEKEIAQIIKLHILIPKETLKNWEEKIVNYSDKRVTHDKIVSLNERIKDILKRYPQMKDKENEFRPLLEEIEKEIFNKIGWEHESLKELKN